MREVECEDADLVGWKKVDEALSLFYGVIIGMNSSLELVFCLIETFSKVN
jgi:hypothetical protein